MSRTDVESQEEVDEEEEEPVDHRRRVIFSVVSLVAFGSLAWMAYEMPLGEATDPGPGFFPLLVALIGVVGSLLMLVESSLKAKSAPVQATKGASRVSWIYVSYIVGLALVIPFLGIYISGVLFAAVCVKTIGSLSYLKSLLYGVAIGGVLSFLAVDVLGIRIQAWPAF